MITINNKLKHEVSHDFKCVYLVKNWEKKYYYLEEKSIYEKF